MNSKKFAFACCEVDGDDKDCDLVFPLASAQDNITGFDQAPNQIPFFFTWYSVLVATCYGACSSE